MEPIARPVERRQIFVVSERITRRQRRIGHGGGLDRLLVVQCFFVAVYMPAIVSNRPEDAVNRVAWSRKLNVAVATSRNDSLGQR